MARRVLSAQIAHETNTFSKQPATLARYKARTYLEGDAIAAALSGANHEMAAHLDAAAEYGWSLTQPVCAFATPSGPTPAADWAALCAPVRAALAAGPWDGVALALHGAMVTEDEPDAEGALLQIVRDAVGPDVPIALTLDLHGNVSARMAALSDILIGYRTYPHLDMYAIAREACAMLDAAMAGRRAFRTVVRQPATLLGADLGRTTAPGNAMERLLAAARAAEAAAEVDAVTIFGGFPWADIPDAGPCVTLTGARDAPGLEAVADAIAAEIWETRAETSVVPLTIAEAVAKAKAGEGSGRPLVIADMTDNPGMGGYGDHVGLLRAMVEAGLEGALFAKCADPEAAAAAVAAGEGAEVTLSLGSRTDPALYGPPFETTALVERVIDGAYVNEGPMFAGLPLSLGPSALLRMGGVRAIVATNTLQVMDLNMPRAFGLAPETLDTIVVKSAQHFRAAFAPIAREIVLADSGALASPDLTRFPFSKLRRPIWPLDA